MVFSETIRLEDEEMFDQARLNLIKVE